MGDQRLKDIELDESEQTLLEETSRELERIISMFEAGED